MKPPTDAKWIKAEKGEGLSIIYYDKEGNQLIRRKDPAKGSLKGSKAWRHNNPGNLAMGPHARQHGAMGSASYKILDEEGREKEYIFAIFSSYEVGRIAMVALLIAENHLLRAVIVHGQNQIYLRPFPHDPSYKSIVC
jgi:hypothetical protein